MTLEDVFDQIVAAGWGVESTTVNRADGVRYRITISRDTIVFGGVGDTPVEALNFALVEYSKIVSHIASIASVVQSLTES